MRLFHVVDPADGRTGVRPHPPTRAAPQNPHDRTRTTESRSSVHSLKPARLRAVLAVTLIAVGSAACGSSADGRAGSSITPPVSSPPASPHHQAYTLPIDAYLIAPADFERIERAQILLVETCMKRYGFTLKLAEPATTAQGNRYGPTDRAFAAARGYHSALPRTDPEPQTPTREMVKVLGTTGSPTVRSYKGADVPPGGCFGEANAKLTEGGGILQDPEVSTAVNFESFPESAKAAPVRNAFAAWSSCMKEKGFAYPTPLDAINDPRWNTEEPSALEISTAVAEVECKERTDTVSIWNSAEAELQRKDIKKRLGALRKGRERIDVTVRNARTELAAEGARTAS